MDAAALISLISFSAWDHRQQRKWMAAKRTPRKLFKLFKLLKLLKLLHLWWQSGPTASQLQPQQLPLPSSTPNVYSNAFTLTQLSTNSTKSFFFFNSIPHHLSLLAAVSAFTSSNNSPINYFKFPNLENPVSLNPKPDDARDPKRSNSHN